MTRNEVFKLIDGEREFQEKLRADGKFESVAHSVGDFLTMLATYTRKAQDAWTLNKGDQAALAELRKVAAIAVAAMEQHGAPARAS